MNSNLSDWLWKGRMKILPGILTLALILDLACHANGSGSPSKRKAQSFPGEQSAASRQALPSDALARLETGPARHGAGITSLALSPDGKFLAAGGTENTLWLWEIGTWKLVQQVSGHGKGGIAFSPDSQILASGGGPQDPSVRLWLVSSGKELRRFPIPPGPKTEWEVSICMAFSADSALLATGCHDGTARLFDVATGRQLRQLPQSWTTVSTVTFSPDGRILATGSHSKSICLWEVSSGKVLGLWEGHSAGVNSLAYGADEEFLVSGSFDGTVRLWQLPSRKESGRLVGPPGPVWAVAVSPDGKMVASGGEDLTVRLWEVASRKLRGEFRGHNGQVMSIGLSPDGSMLASGSYDTTVILWDLTGGKSKDPPRENPLSAAKVEGLWQELASPDGAQAYRAMWSLQLSPRQAIPLLEKRLASVISVNSARLDQLIAALDSENFLTREHATAELEKFGTLAEPALRKTLLGSPSVEVRRRLKALLNQIEGPVTSCQQLGVLRSLEVLEHVGTADARRVLAMVAQGAAETRPAREAKEALKRLGRKPLTGGP